MAVQHLDEEQVFKVACDIKSAEVQAVYLKQVCADNVDLYNRVVTLLRAQAEQPDFLDSPVSAIVVADEPIIEQAGGRIGPYKLLQQLGEGGMGIVFMAEQREPVERRVALKVVKPGMDTQQVIARFEAERQALAMMDHPSIARVFEAGTTDSGRPYFVMELVRGISITDYCDQHQLTPRQRLVLFVSVCHAVQHAHQKGVIHRDLKPSNVLVAEYDEEPVAKIIDFGVAKAIGQQLTDKTMFTQIGQLVGTVDYMSPEQAKLNQLDVDTRTDIYSLGVLLYELLTGETPFERKRLHGEALDEMLRIIREEDPPRPSTRLSSSGTLPSIAAHRHMEPAKLTSLVRGELDWIVMKALEKDRSRRYQTANALAMDVQRYLADEPVLACPPSGAYRFHKFARRNKAAFIAAGAISAVLLAGIVLSAWQAIRATHAERVAEEARAAEANERYKAEQQRKQAEANLRQAQAAVDESFTMVSESKLLDVPGLQPLRKDLLESALRFYQGFALDRSSDPRVMAGVAVTYLRIAQINSSLNRNDDAIAAVRQALDIIDRLRKDHPHDLESLSKLAGFCTERRWTQFGTEVPRNPLAAFQTLVRLEATWEKLAAANPTVVAFQSDLAAIDASVGALLHWSGRPSDAAKHFEKAVAISEQLVAADPHASRYRAALADVSLQLAATQTANGRVGEALALTRRATELGEELVAQFPKVAAYRSGLSASLIRLGDRIASEQPKQAEESYRRGVVLARSLLDEFPGHRLYQESLSSAVVQLGKLVHTQGRRAEAEQIFQQLLRKLQEQVATCPNDVKAREGLAFGCFYVAERVPPVPNQPAISESFYHMALALFLDIADENPGTYASQIAHCHHNLGWLKLQSNRLAESRSDYQRAAAEFKKLVMGQPREPMYPLCLADAYRALSVILEREGRPSEALDAAQDAMRTAPKEQAVRTRLLEVIDETDNAQRRNEALALLQPVLQVKPNNAMDWQLRGRIHATMGQTDEAAADFIQAIDLSDANGGGFFSPRKVTCRELARWEAVFEKVAELRPNEPALWIGRGQYRALRGQWAEAADDYAKVVHGQPLSDETFDYAALLLLLDKRPRYQQFCEGLVAQTGEPQGFDAYGLARICSIGQPEGIDSSRIVDWANRGLRDRPPWTLTVLALAETRAGQFEQAIAHFQESNTLPGSEELKARNFFGLAIAYHRLGQIDAARNAAKEARQLFQSAHASGPGGAAHLFAPGEWLEQNLLSREAEALIQGQASSTAEAAKDR